MTIEELNVIITAQNKEFNKHLDEVNGQLDTLGKKAESSARSTSGAFRSMAAVLSSLGIAKLLGDLNNAYTVQMMNETKLETVMRNRIGATEEEIASVKRLTAAQQQIGIIGDEILRGTTQGELQALKNDFGDLKEEIGATFQPLLGVLIPMVSDGLQAVRPYVEKLGEGFQTVADYISALSPETKKLITQGVMSVPVIMAVTKGMRLLSLATRSASGWLWVIVTVLLLLTAYRKIKDAGDSTASSLDKQEESANNAATGISNLNDSVGELGETTKKSLAAVDKLNIINGSAGNIISVDTEGISVAADEAATLKKDLEAATEDNLEIGVDLSWEGIRESFSAMWDWLKNKGLPAFSETVENTWEDIKETGNLFKDAFDFDSETQLQSLRTLNEKVEEIFGEDWTNFWQEVGTTILKGLQGTPQERQEALDTWGEWLESLNNEMLESLPFYNECWSNLWQSAGSNKFDADFAFLYPGLAQIKETANQYPDLISNMSETIVENLKQGLSAEEALETARAELLTTDKMVYYYDRKGATLADVQRWQNNLIESGQLYQYEDYSDLVPAYKPDYSGRERQSISSLRSMDDSESRSQNFNITVISELDGEKIGEFSRRYSARELARSNGY